MSESSGRRCWDRDFLFRQEGEKMPGRRQYPYSKKKPGDGAPVLLPDACSNKKASP